MEKIMSAYGQSFTFNGKSSEDYGVRFVKFDIETDDDIGLNYEISKSSLISKRSKVYSHSKKYSDVLNFTIALCKNDFTKFTQEERRPIISWLTSPKTYKEFTVQDNKKLKYHYNITYFAVCNGYKEISPAPNLKYGLQFTFECNAPYGFSNEKQVSFNSSEASEFVCQVESDELEDEIFPYLSITPKSTGEIKLCNDSFPNREFILKGSANNTLSIDSEIGIISDTADVFNYDTDTNLLWLKLKNGENTISISGDCEGYVKWREPRKVGI